MNPGTGPIELDLRRSARYRRAGLALGVMRLHARGAVLSVADLGSGEHARVPLTLGEPTPCHGRTLTALAVDPGDPGSLRLRIAPGPGGPPTSG